MMKNAKLRNTTELERLRDNLHNALIEQNLIPSELAAKAVLPLPSITRILHRQVKNPGIDLVISLAKGLGKSVSELIGDSASRSAPGSFSFFVMSGGSGPSMMIDLARYLGADISDLLDHDAGDEKLRALCALECEDRIGILNTLTTIAVNEGVNIERCFGTTQAGKARLLLVLESDQRARLERAVQRIREFDLFDVAVLRDDQEMDRCMPAAILDAEASPESTMLMKDIMEFLNSRSEVD